MAAAAASSSSSVSGEPPAEEASPAIYSFGRPWPELNEGLSYTDVFRCADTTTTTTLIDFYFANYKSSAPLQGWIQRIRNGQIMVDGAVITDPNTILRDGSTLVYHRLPWKEPFAPHVLEVLYEDDDMVALNKPSGLQVLPGGLFQQRTVLAQVQWKEWKMPKSCCSKRKDARSHPAPVHRLGRGTSGILLCAKTKLAKVHLSSYFAEGTINSGSKRHDPDFGKARRVSKFYRALVSGILEYDEVVITQPVGLVYYPGVAQGIYAASSSGKPAMSKVYVLEKKMQQNQTLVQVEIFSGRPHQIRIHVAYIGHPLVGDPLYGVGGQPKFDVLEYTDGSFAHDGGYERPLQPVPGDCGYHLHAHRLILCHPTTEKTGTCSIEAEQSVAIQGIKITRAKVSAIRNHQIIKFTAPLPRILRTQGELNARALSSNDDPAVTT